LNILGIGGYSHDSAAALVVDGRIVAAVAEERLSRVKHQGGVPRLAVDYCLREAGLRLEDIDHIGAYMRTGLRLGKRLPYRLACLPRHPLYSAGFMGYELLHNLEYARGMQSLRRGKARLHYMEHHPAHAASAFLCSPFDTAALLSIDYVGEWDCTWMGVGEGTRLRKLRSMHYPNSLGVFYSAITDYLGFLRASDEYKVMGLASYGEPVYAEDFLRMLRPGDGGYDIDLDMTQWPWLPGSRRGYFSPKFLERFGPPRRKEEPIEPRHQNIAASAQKALEETVLGMARWLHRETGQRHLCLAGGVALNCSMNGRLLRESPFERIFIQPASGDDGIAVGAALQLHGQYAGQTNIPHPAAGAPPQGTPFEGGPRLELTHAYLGPGYTDEEISAALEGGGTPYEVCDDIEARTATLLAEGKIVGWFQGRMEFGPRALGNRSILADPTRPDMQDKLNTQVKHREEFRPFAPVVTEEDAPRFFDGCARSPFMLFVHPVRPEARPLLPAITHIDGTARVQTLRREENPRFYQLLREFEQRRGVPVLVNTSFNVMGGPIVNTPSDAIRCFLGTGIDALVMGNCLVRKG
jgi:carbamoyltransferase